MKTLEECRAEIDRIDREMQRLFEARMQVAEDVAKYKIAHDLPVLDQVREQAVLDSRTKELAKEENAVAYRSFLSHVMKLSKARQRELLAASSSPSVRVLPVTLEGGDYDIMIGENLLFRAGQFLDLDRKVLVVTDDGVPPSYAETVASQCKDPVVVTIPQGEGSKNLANFEKLLSEMLSHGFTRTDCVVAVGGGVVGDLAGVVASAYMRGVDFYNIPTTLLSQVDSSIGGKVAVDFLGVKNIVGAFYQPKRVLISPEVLKTLPQKQYAAGMAEVIKMATTCDVEFFDMLQNGFADGQELIADVIFRAISIKKFVVEQDEKEKNLRRVLNFGHTIGHAVESGEVGRRLHGECVAIGMIPMCDENVRKSLIPLLEKFNLPTKTLVDDYTLLEYIRHDKKASGDKINVVYVPRIGEFCFREVTAEELLTFMEEIR